MQMCPWCNKVYDESEYCKCPYCSGELEEEVEKRYFKICPNCDGTMFWFDGEWLCSDCGETIETDEDDHDGMIVG